MHLELYYIKSDDLYQLSLAMAMLGGAKLFCWLASLLMSNVMTATFFLFSNTGKCMCVCEGICHVHSIIF